MKKAPLHLAAALALTLSISSVASAKELFDNFYFFGDSLTDMGNTPDAPYTTQGDSTWANYFANKFNSNATPSNNGGNDFAIVGALTACVAEQSQAYLASVGNKADPNALYSVWAGANDINYGILVFGNDPSQIIDIGVGNTNYVVQGLHGAGAKYIMVFNLPDLGKTPLGESFGSYVSGVLSQVTQAYNQVLASTLSADGFDVIQVDVFSLFNDFLAHPQHFGLANFTDLFYTPPGGDPTQDEHPTGYGHQMIADYVYSIIEGPTRAAILAEAPFSVMDAQNFSNESQLYNVRTHLTNLAIGQTTTFASATYTPYEQDNQGTEGPGFDAHNTNLSAGFIRRINNNLIAGASVAHSFGHVDFGQNTGGFDMTENMASLFTGYQYDKFYADGMVNYGVINDSSITRNIPIGVSQNEASGDTTGTQAGADLILGYNIINRDNLQTGPFVNADYQYIHINAYSETGSIDSIAEQFDSQSNNSFTTGLGWQIADTININSTPLMPFVQLSYNHQWLNEDRDVGAGLTSLPGSHFSVPVSGPGTNYILATAGISTNIARAVSLSLGYNTTLFYSGAHTQNVNASIQVLL